MPGLTNGPKIPASPGRTQFNQFGLHATLAVKTIQALYYKAGKDRLLTIVLVPPGRETPIRVYVPSWIGRQRKSSRHMPVAGRSNAHLKRKQFLGLEDPANRVRKAVERTAPWRVHLQLGGGLVSPTGHQLVRFPFRPWYLKKEEPSFADMLTTLRLVSYDEKTEQLLPKQCA